MEIQSVLYSNSHQIVAQLTKDETGDIKQVEICSENLKNSLSINGILIPKVDRKDQKARLYLKDQSSDPRYFAQLFMKIIYQQDLARGGFYWKDAPSQTPSQLFEQQFNYLTI
ncbi:hypothetical protein [Rhabdochlamydiaceae symbiont of Dictyostelium giganteum]|uniref:hypothetical protein n=1 Tax=Rhabdochlamydiaceae symbiont of Dictyostelium giganteum TaxID=3342349 RepID=UPI0038501C8F